LLVNSRTLEALRWGFSTASALLAGAWAGATLFAGAIVAPIVFGRVQAPLSGDAMTEVFGRLARAGLLASALLATFEVVLHLVHLRLKEASPRVSPTRLLTILALCALAFASALWNTPAIAELHERGAVRGVGLLGAELERHHVLAKRLGTALLVALVALVCQQQRALVTIRPQS
jgi:hypothetical protein